MDFALSEEQQFLQNTVKDYLERECPLDRVRQCVQDSVTKDTQLCNGLLELGVPGIVVREEYGGVNLSYLEAALVAEALGSAIAPVPFIGSSVIAPFAITHAGSDQQKEEWLPKIASGEVTVGIAFTENIANREGSHTTAVNGTIAGEPTFVLDGIDADVYLIATQDSAIYLMSANDAETTSLKSVDRTRSLAKLTIKNATAELLPDSVANNTLSKAIDLGRIMLSADTLGAANVMLEKAVEYAKERKQFNRVIGSFQAVKHMCAEMAAELEPCRSLVWYAAHSARAIPEETHLVACHAKAHTSEVGRFVARKATEVHGGMGFTDLLGLHYWFKRIGLNRQLLGTPEMVREEAAKAQGWIQS